jgi:hypothetical protein
MWYYLSMITLTIAQQLVEATTAGKKAAVTKKINQIAAEAARQGKNPKMVIAGFKAAATRLRNTV